MFEQLSATAITALLPEMNYTLPYVGVVNFQEPAAAFLVFLALTIGFWVLRRVVLLYVKKATERTKTDIDDVLVDTVRGVRAWVYMVVALYAALQFFPIPELADTIITALFLFAITWQIIEVLVRFVDFFSTRFLARDHDGDGEVDPNAATMAHMMALVARIALWAFGGIFVLSNLGIEITSLVAGLGIGGVAVAFALQGVLSDLFASFSIFFDKPFRVGDFIIVGGDMGVVEKIGVKSTRIRTLEGQELVVSNNELTTARVNNYKKMEERRIVVQFGVTYETPAAKLRQIPEMVTRIFDGLDGTRLDRVHFAKYGDFALIFEVVYYVTSPDYNTYMDIQQSFNFTLFDRFAEAGIDFAYPTQLVYTKAVTPAAS